MRFSQSGFSLAQLLIVIAIMGILAAIAYPSYQVYAQKNRMRAAQAALLDNAHFMERLYRQKGTFKSSSTEWPELPNSATEHFCIRPNNNAKGFPDHQFTLKAVAFDTAREPRVLKIDESLTFYLCTTSSSSCDEKDAFFKGTEDKNCELFQP